MGRAKPVPLYLYMALVAGLMISGGSRAVAQTGPSGRIIDLGPDWTGPYVGAQLGFGRGGGAASNLDSLIGGYAGYRWDYGTTVLGTELDVTLADSAMNNVATVDSIARLKVQAGAEAGDGLLYVTLGAAWADTSVGNEAGYLGGVGYAHALGRGVSVGGEILYERFDNVDAAGNDLQATTFNARVTFSF